MMKNDILAAGVIYNGILALASFGMLIGVAVLYRRKCDGRKKIQ